MKTNYSNAVLLVHGGAGVIRRDLLTPAFDAACREGLTAALAAGRAALGGGGSALDAVCAAVQVLEDDPHFNAGRGASYTHDGRHELDSSLMDGATHRAGAVAGVTTVKNPVLAARAVMEQTPYVLLAGPGADAFAQSVGFAPVENTYFDTDHRYDELAALAPPPAKLGTVGAVACDGAGRVAAATSTGGMTGKEWGRVGDAPLIGAGTWADNSSCAVSATGYGEYFIRYAVARTIAARMEFAHATLPDAARAVIHETLKSAGGEGGVIALTPQGDGVLSFNTPGMYRGVLLADGTIHVGIYDDENE